MGQTMHEQEQLNYEPLPMQEPLEETFTLEDIIREFGSQAQENTQPEPQEQGSAQPEPQTEPVEPAEEPSPIRLEPVRPKKEAPPLPPITEERLQSLAAQLRGVRVRMVLCALLSVLSFLLAAACEFELGHLVGLGDGRAMAVAMSLLWLGSALCACDILARGLWKLVLLRFDGNSLVSFASILLAIDAVQAIAAGRTPYCAVGSAELTFALWTKWNDLQGRLSAGRVLYGARNPAALYRVDTPEGCCLLCGPAQLEQFRRDTRTTDLVSRILRWYVPIAIAVTLAAATALHFWLNRPWLRCWLVMLLGCAPLCGALGYTRAFALLSRRLEANGAVIGGWKGAKIFRGKTTIPLKDEDLFSIGSISLNGTKLYRGHNLDEAARYAAATTEVSGCPLAPVFRELRYAQDCPKARAGKYRYYEGGGLGAEVEGNVVLMGTLPFMRSMGVHMDAGMKVRRAVYLSINGELACVFAVKYKADPAVGSGLLAMLDHRCFQLTLATRDFLLTPEQIQYKYKIPAKCFRYPRIPARFLLAEQKASGQAQGAILRQSSFANFAAAACGGRQLYSSTVAGAVLHLLSGIIGLVVTLSLMAVGAFQTASVFKLLVFLLVWALPSVIVSGWTKRRG